jgi:hypothetical protein
MGSITEITLLGGERHSVEGDVKEVEQLILSAARGSIMQFAWFTDARTAELVGVNPEHVMALRDVTSTATMAPPRGDPSG